MQNFKFYVQSKVGAVKGKDGLSYDTWSFDAKDVNGFIMQSKALGDLLMKAHRELGD